MNSERWQKIKSVFDAASDLDPALRSAFLAKTCADDPDLYAEVAKLMDSFENAASFIENPAAMELIEPNESLQPGQQFAHYKIVRQIGVGGMGEVYLAKDEKLGRSVAVKILNEEFSRHESNVQRFIQEAKAASSLNHPNILVIHEINVSGNANYIVSEYVEGMTLRGVIGEAALKRPEMLDIAIQVAEALAAAHAANIVHRDIKPENVVVRPDGYVKVLDFGLAKLIEQNTAGLEDATAKQNQTAKGLIMGTVNYMSPEQAKAERVDQRTDIFSLGIVIYEMVAARTPFQGDSTSETFANLINKEPQPLSRYAANVEDELQRIISKALRKNKNERYQVIEDLRSDLKTLRENLDFDERLERTNAPHVDNATAALPPSVKGVVKQTDEIKDHTTAGEKKRRSYVAALATIFVVAALSVSYYFLLGQRMFTTPDGRRSLAVLPFVNSSQDPNAEYLSDGITDSVINNLSQLSNLKVTSRGSAFRFKTNQADLQNVASQLGVDSLVTGDVKQLGDKFIINVRLMNARDDSQIWGNQYVRTSADVIAAQNEIAQAVAQNLRVKLTSSETQLLSKRYTDNVEAWQLFQRGRFHVFKLTPPEVQRGIGYLQQAIELDPSYAIAYVGLSEAWRTQALAGEMEPRDLFSKAKATSRKAIEIDPSLAEGYGSLAVSSFWFDWDWEESEKLHKRAIELNPNSAITHVFYAHLLSNTGRHDEALAEMRRALELDPLSPFANALEGQFLVHAGKIDEGLTRLQKTFELDPNFYFPHMFASSAYIDKGMFEQGLVEARRASQLGPNQAMSEVLAGYALGRLGRRDEALAVINALTERSKTRFVPPSHIALVYNGLGESDEAIAWLEKAYEARDPKLTFLKVERKWDNMRSNRAFADLIRRMHLE